MARRRDYAREYAQRKAKAEFEGRSTTEARGHGQTPSSPVAALRNPLRYPRYIARHRDELDALAERRLAERETPDPYITERDAGAFTWLYPNAVLTGQGESIPGYDFGRSYDTLADAQRRAADSHAPAGVVVIVDRGPDAPRFRRFELWFARYPRDTKHDRRRSRQWRENLRRARAA